jgi:hypothetical protein
MLRRGLLVLLSAVIVARPLVRGEDAGLVSDFSNPGHMTITLLAFIGCAGWAGWRLWARQPALHVGPIEGLLFILPLLFFIGSAFAPYHRAAWLASWEWVGLLLTVFLVRQLAVRPEEQRGLMAVLLAGAVALSVQGLYQTVWEIPATYRTMENWPEDDSAHLKTDSAAGNLTVRTRAIQPDEYVDKYLDQRLLLATPLEKYELLQRVQRRQVHGPFFHPSSLAACLVLLLPMLFGAVIVARRDDYPGWLRTMAGVFASMSIVVLLLTRCWSAVAAVGLVGLVVVGLYWPARRGGLKVGLLGATLLAGVASYLLVRTGALAHDLARWREVWPTSWRVVQEYGQRGVGLSQFAFFYPRFMSETSGANQVNPGSAVLELWAEGGLAVLFVFVVAMVVFFVAVRRWWNAGVAPVGFARRAGGIQPPISQPDFSRLPGDAAPPPVRWEYYIGGMVGIVLAFLIRAFGLPVEDLASEAVAAGLQSIAWFAAVAIYERIAWSEKQRVACLTAGITAMLLTLMFNAGIGFPSVAGLFWIAVALVLAVVTPRPVEWLSRHQVAYLLPLPVFIAAAFCYFAFVFYPPSAGAAADRRVRYASDYLHAQLAKAPEERQLRDHVGFIQQRILFPLLLADKEDPGNMRLRVELANWFGELDRLRNQSVSRQAVDWAREARKANPEGREGFEVEADVRTRFARFQIVQAENLEKEAGIRFTQTSGDALRRAGLPDMVLEKLRPMNSREFKTPEDFLNELKKLLSVEEFKRFQDPLVSQAEKEFREAKKIPARQREKLKRDAAAKRIMANHHFEQAARALLDYVPRDPTSPALHYHIADALYSAGKIDEAREEIHKAFSLDGKVAPPRKLNDPQREQLAAWIRKESDR